MSTISNKTNLVKKPIQVSVVKSNLVLRRYEFKPSKNFPKRKKGKKEKGFQKTIHSKNQVSKEKIKIILPPDLPTPNLVRKNPCQENPYKNNHVRKNLTNLRTEIFERFEHYIEKEKER